MWRELRYAVPSRLDTAQLEGSPVGQRRTRKEIDGLIVDAARAVFAEKGYASATTREIAERAGVHAPMVYRRFPTKADLFEAAVLAPFDDVVSSYLAAREAQAATPTSTEDLVRAFVEPLYALLSDHRDLALALVASRDFRGAPEPRADEPAENMLVGLLDRLDPRIENDVIRRPLRMDMPATMHVIVGMILGLALLDEQVLISRDKRLSHRRLVDEMVNLVLYGVLLRSERPTGSGSPGGPVAGETKDIEDLLLDRMASLERRALLTERKIERLTDRMAVSSDDNLAGGVGSQPGPVAS